jgi:hypothetical protein
VKLHSGGFRSWSCYRYVAIAAEDIGMDAINLVITVCAVLSPANCQEKNLVFASNFSLQQCMMAAPPYIAQWIGEHPQYQAVKWRCEYPHSREKT